jgi:hypothetical protein
LDLYSDPLHTRLISLFSQVPAGDITMSVKGIIVHCHHGICYGILMGCVVACSVVGIHWEWMVESIVAVQLFMILL